VRNRWIAYLLRCGDGSLYAGVTTDLDARLAAHRGEVPGKGAKYTRRRGPFEVVWTQPAKDRSEAHRIEWRLKRLTRAAKLDLVRRRGRVKLEGR
jgi:putative endonuclease